MRRLTAFTLAVLFSTPLLAMHCPMDMAKIDEQLETNPPKDAATLQQVRELRAEGEQLHQAGKAIDHWQQQHCRGTQRCQGNGNGN